MTKPWFRRTARRRGFGYTVDSVEGHLACIAFLVVVTTVFSGVLAGTLLLGWPRPAASALSGLSSLAVIAGFLRLVRLKAGPK